MKIYAVYFTTISYNQANSDTPEPLDALDHLETPDSPDLGETLVSLDLVAGSVLEWRVS